MKLLIVDDEKPARNKIRSYLTEEKVIDTIDEAENGIEAVQKIQDNKPDLVFLDIQMPGMTGFEVIERIGVENMPVVVFVTAYDQYAIDAFEVQALDYLLKPYDLDRFKRAFYRARDILQLKTNNTAILTSLIAEFNRKKNYLQRLVVNIGHHYFYVNTGEIIYIAAAEKYANLHTNNDSYLIRDTMTNLEQQLDPAKFKRIHRSYIVNVDYIKEMQPWSHGDYVVILKNGTKLTLSRRFRDRLFGRS